MDKTRAPMIVGSDIPTIHQGHVYLSEVDECINGWLAAHGRVTLPEGGYKHSRTSHAYETTLEVFRDVLRGQREIAPGLDLFDQDVHLLRRLATEYISSSKVAGRQVAHTTANQRRAILSSFYTYVQREQVYLYNPIDGVKPVKPREDEEDHAAMPLEMEVVKQALDAINLDTLEGKRDYALLYLALTTGRRASEIARLKWGDIRMEVGYPTAHFFCKGNKKKHDVLVPEVVDALEVYRVDLVRQLAKRGKSVGKETPTFVSFSNANYGGRLTIQAIGRLCADHLQGESRVHALRHTFAVRAKDLGMSLSEISERLGHSNEKITFDYLKTKSCEADTFAGAFESLYGKRIRKV